MATVCVAGSIAWTKAVIGTAFTSVAPVVTATSGAAWPNTVFPGIVNVAVVNVPVVRMSRTPRSDGTIVSVAVGVVNVGDVPVTAIAWGVMSAIG